MFCEGMTVKEAAALVGKSTDTVYRWKRKGFDISDTAALLKYSAEQDHRACGRSFELALTRNGSGVNGATHAPVVENVRDRGQPLPEPELSEADVWIDLPSPFPLEDGRQALALLGSLKVDCARRLAGCKLSVELAQETSIGLRKPNGSRNSRSAVTITRTAVVSYLPSLTEREALRVGNGRGI